jgi:DMSO/TMAO reductase YedYZ molybdopterin-dependent catalytic subunit
MISRRRLLEGAGVGAVFAGSGLGSGLGSLWGLDPTAASAASLDMPKGLPSGVRAEAVLEALPGKKPLIKLTYRPPNYETPIADFRAAITPNDAFFVRYHLADIPAVDARTWRLTVGGEGASGRVQLSLDDLKAMPATEVVAVCQCSGNRRGLFEPHVVGVEWGYGAMGCARFKGVRLKDVLDKVGLKKEAIELVLDGADGPVLDSTPDFVKSIPVAKAIEDGLVAYEMNGQPLPHFNGFPARVVVPGWTATYWVKHITSITATTKPFEGFWMKSAYRVPLGRFPLVARFSSQDTDVNTPITEMVVNSLITSHDDGSDVKAGAPLAIGGVAWDAGYGIRTVEVSADGGRTFSAAQLGEDLGRFAFRTFSFPITPAARGKLAVTARAINKVGQTQTAELIQNPAGYHHNVMHTVTLNVA